MLLHYRIKQCFFIIAFWMRCPWKLLRALCSSLCISLYWCSYAVWLLCSSVQSPISNYRYLLQHLARYCLLRFLSVIDTGVFSSLRNNINCHFQLSWMERSEVFAMSRGIQNRCLVITVYSSRYWKGYRNKWRQGFVQTFIRNFRSSF
jgi:hypothetical protein